MSPRPIFKGRVAYLKDKEIWVVDGFGIETPTEFSGISRILSSPNGKLVAFVNADDGQVSALDVNSLESQVISSEGHLGQKGCPGTEISLTDWSPDSRKSRAGL